jgi:hypothetical protein
VTWGRAVLDAVLVAAVTALLIVGAESVAVTGSVSLWVTVVRPRHRRKP